MLRRSHNQLESLNFSFTECVPATETRIVVSGVVFYNLVNMLLRSPVFKRGSGPFRIVGQFCVCQNQPYPCEFNSFSVLVRKQARARHVCYDDLIINWSL